jgi:hypothetical protein
LIVGAILVELVSAFVHSYSSRTENSGHIADATQSPQGEVVARLVVHATTSSKTEMAMAAMANTTVMFVDQTLTRENALRVLDNIASRQ